MIAHPFCSTLEMFDWHSRVLPGDILSFVFPLAHVSVRRNRVVPISARLHSLATRGKLPCLAGTRRFANEEQVEVVSRKSSTS